MGARKAGSLWPLLRLQNSSLVSVLPKRDFLELTSLFRHYSRCSCYYNFAMMLSKLWTEYRRKISSYPQERCKHSLSITSLRKAGKTGTIFLTCEKSHDQWDCFSSKREDFYSVREFALSEFQYFSITLDYAMQICIILQPPSAWQG